MKLKNFFEQKKFFNRMLIWMSLAFVFILIIFSLISYVNVQNIVSQNIIKNNRIILNQVKFNIENINSTIKDMCNNLYGNYDLAQLMYDDTNTFDNILRMQNAANAFVSSPFVDSVSVYNGTSSTLYTLSRSITTDRNIFADIIKKKGMVPKLKPFIMEIKDDSDRTLKKEKVMTYCLYQYTNKDNVPQGALLVNVKVSWLVNNIKQINLAEGPNDNVFVLNNEGDFLASTLKEGEYPDYIRQLFTDFTQGKVEQENKKGYIIRNIDNVPCMITFSNVESAGIILIKTQEYDKVFSLFTKMKVTLGIITIIFLIAAFAAVISVSRVVYKPLGKLVTRIGVDMDGDGNPGTEKDEIIYLEKVFEQSREKMSKYEKDDISRRNLIKEFYLKKLLTETFDFKNTNLQQQFAENHINLAPDGIYALCLLRMDNYAEIKSKYNIEDINLSKFAIMNIACEIISSGYRNEGVELDDDKVAIIICMDKKYESNNSYYADIEKLIKQSQANILEYYGISVSAALSGCSSKIHELPKLYAETQRNSEYRLVRGKMSVITPAMVAGNNENRKNQYSFDFEKKLSENIKAGNEKEIESNLRRFVTDVSGFDYKSIITSMLSVIDIMEKSMQDINQFGLEPVYIDFASINRRIFKIETLDEFVNIVRENLKLLVEKKGNNTGNEKHLLIAENVMQLIDNDFTNSTLCLASIAASLKMSSVYLGQIFKNIVKMSVGEYISEVRLAKTAEWLEKTDLSINEVLEKVGVENKTYFYSLFKKKYGVTPKEYKLRNSMNKLE